MLFWNILRQRHPVGDEEMNAYIDGELDAAARSRVEAHLDSCAACRDAIDELRMVSQALQSLPRAQAPRSFALREADVEPAPAQPAGWLAGATPLLGGVAAVAFLALFVLVGVDVTGRSADSDATSAGARLSSEMTEQDTTFGADIREGLPEAGSPTRDAGNEPALSDGGAAPPEALLPATGGDLPNDDSPKNGDVAIDENPADDGMPEVQNLESGDDDLSSLRIAEAATAAVAIVAGGSLALVWRRRRA